MLEVEAGGTIASYFPVQYVTRAVAELGCLTVSFARALAPFQAILSGLIVW